VDLIDVIGQWSWFIVWSLLLVASSLLVYLGLGGTVVILALALIHALVTGFHPIGWGLLAWLAGLVVLGEGLEFVVGTFYAARKGATRRGVIGAFVGGLLGAALGNGVVPVIGAVLGSFVGAFCGAVLGEFLHTRQLEPGLRVGAHSFLGRLLAILIKHVIALVMVFLILRATRP